MLSFMVPVIALIVIVVIGIVVIAELIFRYAHDDWPFGRPFRKPR
jgi:hypothetical protein